MKKREEIEDRYKIDFSSLFANKEEFNKEFLRVSKLIDKIKKYNKHILDNENKLYEVLNLDKEISCYLERLYVYTNLLNTVCLKTTTDENSTNFNNVRGLYAKYALNASFIVPEILKSDFKLIKDYIKKDSRLKEFEYNLKEIFRTKKHILSSEEEVIYNKFLHSASSIKTIFTSLTNIDLKFDDITIDKEKLELNLVNYELFLEKGNRKVRKDAFKKIHKGLGKINNTAALLLESEINNNKELSFIRKYNSSLEYSLDKDNISTSVYESLLKAVNKKIKVLHKEWEIKKRILKLDELHSYDMSLSIVDDYEKEYEFEDARNLVQGSLLIMGKEYSEVLNTIFSERRIDIYPNLYKRNGAYSTSSYLDKSYVFLNYDNTFNSMLTLTHELGHAMHSHYAKNNNTFTNYQAPIFTCEVASQVNEILLHKYLMTKAKSNKEKLYLLDKFIKRFKLTFATMYAEFEKNINELKTINANILNDKFYEIHKKYYGSAVTLDDDIKYGWAKTTMFFHNFYLYQYATGFSAALQIADNIYKRKNKALENYFDFLKIGSKLDPIESLKIAGVDMTGTKVYYNALKIFEETLNEIEKLYNSEETK